MTRSGGFSLVEVMMAMALMLTITAVMFVLVDPGQARFAAQLEAADMEQRLRAAAGTLHRDLLMAGAGAYQTGNAGALSHYFAPVLPYREGTNHDDPDGAFRTDAITVMYVPSTVAQTTLATDGPSAAEGEVGVEAGGGCPLTDAACGFKNGMTILLYDGSGDYDMFSVTNVQTGTLHVERNGGALTSAYRAHSTTAVELTHVVYYLKSDPVADTYQLVSREGAAGADVPVVDHVVAVRFDYFGEPQPPRLTRALSDPAGPWTTYGPPPPALTRQIPTGGYPAGENCTFMVDPINGLQVPRLAVLAPSADADALVPLTSAELTDGPWCPDGSNIHRWDADLLRIRRIGVTLKVESANAALRGPAGVLFTHGGTSTSGNRWLPDRQVTFQVMPRNLGK